MTGVPSTPPRGVRVTIPVQAMRLKPLPPHDPDEMRKWKAYIRRRPVPKRAGR